MDFNLKNILITEKNTDINYKKWNYLVNKNIAFDTLIENAVGDKYAGIYTPSKAYKKYDYLWVDKDLCFIDNNHFKLNHRLEDKDIKRNIRPHDDFIVYLDKENHIIKRTGNVVKTIKNIPFDKVELYSQNEAIAKNGNRFVKVDLQNEKFEPININFEKDIKDFFIYNTYIYFITGKEIRYGDVYNSDTTEYSVIKLEENIISLKVTDKYIYALTENAKISKIDKILNEVVQMDIEIDRFNKDSIDISACDDYSIIFFDGYNKFYCYFLEDNKLKEEYRFTYPDEINSIDFLENQIIIRNGSQIKFYDNHRFGLTAVDVKKLLTSNSLIELETVSEALNYQKGQLFSNNLKTNHADNIIVENQGLKLSSSSPNIKIDINNLSLLNKTIFAEFKKSERVEMAIASDNKMVSFEFETDKTKLYKLFLCMSEEHCEAFLFENDKEKTISIKKYSESKEKCITLNSAECIVKQVCVIDNILSKFDIDFLSRNKINLDINSSNIQAPYSIVKTNEKGYAFIQEATDEIKGIVRITDNLDLNTPHTALSVQSGKNIQRKIDTLGKHVEDNFSLNTHKHKFNEILDVPLASTDQRGIVFLSNTMSDDDDKAPTVGMLYETYKLANHEHPYIRNDKNDEKNGNLKIKGTLEVTNEIVSNVLKNSNSIISKDLNVTNKLECTGQATFTSLSAKKIESSSEINGNKFIADKINVKHIECFNDIKGNFLNVSNIQCSGNIKSGSFNTANGNITNVSSKQIKTESLNSSNSNLTNISSQNINSNSVRANYLYLNGYLITVG